MPPQLVHQHEDAERIADEQRHTVPSVLMIGEVQRRTAPFVKMTEEAQRHTAPFVRTIGEVQKHNAFFVLMIGEAQRHTAFFILMIGEVQSAKDTLHPLQWASVRTHEGITDIMPELSRPTCCAAEQSNHRLHATEASYSKSTQHKVTTRLHATEAPHSKSTQHKVTTRLHATEASYSKSTQHKVTTRLHATEAPHSKKYTAQSDHQTSCCKETGGQSIRKEGRKEHTTNKYTYWKWRFIPQDIYICMATCSPPQSGPSPPPPPPPPLNPLKTVSSPLPMLHCCTMQK